MNACVVCYEEAQVKSRFRLSIIEKVGTGRVDSLKQNLQTPTGFGVCNWT